MRARQFQPALSSLSPPLRHRCIYRYPPPGHGSHARKAGGYGGAKRYLNGIRARHTWLVTGTPFSSNTDSGTYNTFSVCAGPAAATYPAPARLSFLL